MEIQAIHYDDVKGIWNQAKGGVKFERNGKFGLKNASGEIVLEPVYDQIELCKEYLYTRVGEVTKKFFPFGLVEQATFDPEAPTFYENGKMGLKSTNGGILFPAIYDSVKDWNPYDVVYVRNEEGFHYFNHKGEEILTDWQPIEGSHCDDEPFFIDEKQSTEVIVTRKFVPERLNNNCVKYGEQWVEFDRFPKKDIAQMIGNCELVPMPEDAFSGINSRSTYIYEGFVAISRAQNPIEDCIGQLCQLHAYASTWRFITKVWVHPQSAISMEELKKFWLVYSNHSDFYQHEGVVSRFSEEDWLRIGIGYDKNLAEDEVKVLQIHYFTDRWPDHIESEWVNGVRHLKVEALEELKQRLDAHIQEIRENEGDDAAETVRSEILEGCHISSNVLTTLTTEEELAKYDYLKSLGFHCLDTLWYTCYFMLTALAREGEEKTVAMSQPELEFMTAKTRWLLNNGTSPNFVKSGITALDLVTLTKKLYEHIESPVECQTILSDLEVLMRKKGCRYARELDATDRFWREFKPGWHDETPFETKLYTRKVIIGEDTIIDDETLNNLKNL